MDDSTPFTGPEPGSNGMTLDARHRCTVARTRAAQCLASRNDGPQGKITVLADAYQGKQLNSPNDLVYSATDLSYFTDPPYGLATQGDQTPKRN